MTDNALAVRSPAPALTTEQLKYIANTEFVPPGLRGNLPAILACVATGRELGIGDMAALRAIHIIDGKPTYSAELMVQLVRRRGHSISGAVSEGKAVCRGRRADTGDEMTAEWTLAMAERAGLLGKTNWKKYPEAMLWARAVSQLCRMLFADCFSGAYTSEELGAEFTDELGYAVEGRAALSEPEVIGEATSPSPSEPELDAVLGPADLSGSENAERQTFEEMAQASQARRRARETGE